LIAFAAPVPAAANVSLLAVWLPWMIAVLSARWVFAAAVFSSRLVVIRPALAVCVSLIVCAFWSAMFCAVWAFWFAALFAL
jgi:hypothetical protein